MISETFFGVLSKAPLFKDFDRETAARAISLMSGRIKEYKKGEFLHNDYERYSYFGLVLSGTVAVCVDDIDGNRMIMASVETSQTFAESLALLKIEKPPVYAVALSSAAVLWLKADNLFCETHTDLSIVLQKRFTEIIARRPLQMNERIQVLSKTKLRDRIITYLSALKKDKGEKEITVPLNREDMANYIGANRAALSRELSAMKKDGIIDYKKNKFWILR